jgi:hypothetical protein
MSEARQLAAAYFSNTSNDPWRWAENGRVLVWADGATIAFREELGDILELLAHDGLPPFGAIVLLLAACRGKFPRPALTGLGFEEASTSTGLPSPSQSSRPGQLMLRAWNDPANQEFSEFLAQLRALHQLPAELRNSPKAKANLLAAIFEDFKGRRVQPARELVELLREGALPQDALNETSPLAETNGAVERFVSRRLGQLSAAALELRMRTGLEALPLPAELDLKPAARIRELLTQLQTDPEYQGLAKVARDIMAALYLPRSLSEMDDLALGGFSDISNRGNLDRLLPSELAHDDLTLAVRIALNEALYFRREPPANHPPGRFAVLIDNGVRMWGLPRLFATAAALALMGREERQGQVTAWRAGRTETEWIDLMTRAGLTAHLGILESYNQPGAALKSFLAQVADEPGTETVLITHRDTLTDPDFQSILQQVDCATFYIATVDRDGSFELFLHPHPQSLLCQAVIPLENLFSEPAPGKIPLKDKNWNPDLPLILSIHPFPFLLPVVGKMEKNIRFSLKGGIAVMKNRRLLRWESTRKGAETIIADLPKGTTLWLGTTHFGKKIHVLKHRSSPPVASFTTWNSVTNSVQTREFPLPDVKRIQVWARRGVLYIHTRTQISAIDLESGGQIATKPCPPPPGHLRYFPQPDGSWSFLAYDGQTLELQPVDLDRRVPRDGILALFDREGFEGPWTLTKTGEVFSPEGERVINLGRAITRHEISPDGNFVMVPGIGGSVEFQLINLQDRVCPVLPEIMARRFLTSHVAPPTNPTLITRFDAIHLPLTGGILLRHSKGKWANFVEGPANHIFLVSIQQRTPEFADARPFKPVTGPSDDSFTLKLAAWNDGRRAWLDSRGFLHLKGADSSQPEISLVLTDGPTAAWSSDSEMAGAPFFIPDETRTINSSAMMRKILSFSPGG